MSNNLDAIFYQEAHLAYQFLIDHTNFDANSLGAGLTVDTTNNPSVGTIAGSGFMLTALAIGVERGYDTYDDNLARLKIVLRNFAQHIEQYHGFFIHFASMQTGQRHGKSEYSTIDTVLFLNGLLTADAYFVEEEVHELTKAIYERVDWKLFTFKRNEKYLFHMAYNDITGGAYLAHDQSGWIHQWDMMAEQLSMYVLAAGSKNISATLAQNLYLGFERDFGAYQDYQFVYTPLGALFTHFYSHAWVDFKHYVDANNFDWYQNTKTAVLANRAFCQNHQADFATFKDAWGLSACLGPKHYMGYGAPPFKMASRDLVKGELSRTDGTVAMYAMLSSLPFASAFVKEEVNQLISKYPNLFGPYGFYDSFNHGETLWIAKDYLSIDKGITLLMIDNYYHGTAWQYYQKHPIIISGLQKLGFQKRGEADGNN